MMRLPVLGFYAIGIVGVCTALPIQSVAGGDRNVILLGALVFLSFGAFLAGCVCCRRRKKGFEEFRNESGTPETNKTEYPIFRALSPESQRNVPIVAAAVNNSNENLIEDDFDNNNGPISPADLENIENNNAVDYIRNQNEVGIAIEPSSYSVNRNLVTLNSDADQSQQPLTEIQDVAISSTNHLQESITVHKPELHLEPIIIKDADKDEKFTVVKDVQSNELCMQAIQIETHPDTLPTQDKLQISYIDSVNLEDNFIPIRNSFNVDSSAVIEIENCNDMRHEIWQSLQLEITTPDEEASIKSGSSGKSGEISSVEEALRALDCAIAGDNSLDFGFDDDDDDLTDEDFEGNNSNFQNVIRQLLINNGINSILPDLDEDQVNINLISSSVNSLEYIQTEAELLVDSILNDSQKIAAERSNPLIESEYPICNTTIVVANCYVEHNYMDPMKENEKSEKCTKSSVITPCESIEDFYLFKPLEETSTPFIQNKFTSQFTTEFMPAIAAPSSRKKLLEYEDSPLENCNTNNITFNKTRILNQTYEGSPITENDTFTFPSPENIACNKTFGLDKTYEVSPTTNTTEDANKGFIHPCDPCTSKQAMERDCGGYPSIIYDRDEINSEDMTTITPVNTPIELNYSNETWNRMTKNLSANVAEDGQETTDKNGFESNGWFLHPQANSIYENETFDVEDDEANLELTFEALRKQLAEVLPQPQGISGPPEYSDDEDDVLQNRTFDEYRSPLDGLMGLLDGDSTPAAPVQNELLINYKRALTPILEESEEETCKTFVMNETKCLDSTSTGCVDTGEAIMGVTKTLMASNDTLFNFEDTLGDREDVFSPRTPSRSELQTSNSAKSGKSTEENSIATLESEKLDSNNSGKSTEQEEEEALPAKRIPPKTIDIAECFDLTNDNDLCSPEQQKTFSEGTNSSTTDRISSDISGNVDHDTTFTTNTIDEHTCVTVIVKDDERISEISEPEWGSTPSYGGYEMNSLTDVPSLDYNINIVGDKSVNDDCSDTDDDVQINTTMNYNATIVDNIAQEENGQEDSGNSTHASADDRTTNSDNTSEDETQKCDDTLPDSYLINNQQQLNPSNNLQINLDDREKCRNFLLNEIEISSSQNVHNNKTKQNDNFSEDGDVDSSKENTNPNIKVLLSHLNDFDKISYQKVQTNSQDTVIDKSKNNSSDLYEKDLTNGIHENIFYQPDITILPNKHQQTIINYSVNDVSSGAQNEQNCLMVADEIIGHLSGEEDPWAEPLNDIRFTGPCSELISTSFTVNEWDSDVEDSHSSEEFMYVRGTPTKEEIAEIIKNQSEDIKKDDGKSFPEYGERLYEPDIWSSHEDKIPVADSAEDEISEGSSSEFEGEFIPSCWDSLATPSRSALKSPDKSSSEEEIKIQHNKRVAFKKQRYHSVYEYPRENSSLLPAYSEPYLYSRDNELSLYYTRDSKEEFNNGFTVSSSMRPFHGSQFNALCHTWPTDSDFSWSQVEDLGENIGDKKLTTYSADIKWPQNFDSIDLDDDEDYGNFRPLGESAEMLSDRILGELCHTKSTLRLPLELLPSVDSLSEPKIEPKPSEIFSDRFILPTSSCTGSMDSISSSSGSDRQISFSTFGKSKISSFIEHEQNEQLKPALILIENGPFSDKVKQSDSTDEDSGIESIMKIKSD